MSDIQSLPIKPVDSSAGFTLIELMIAVLIGAILMAGILQLYVSLSRTNADMARTNAQIENGRFAIEMLQEDLVHAGFWGKFVPSFDNRLAPSSSAPTDIPTGTEPNPCQSWPWNGVANYVYGMVGIPIQAFDNSSVPSVGGGCNAAMFQNLKANTDVVIVRHADTCIPGTGNCPAQVNGEVYFQGSQCSTDATTPYPYVLDKTGFTMHMRDCSTSANIRKFISHIYYIRDYSVTAGDGIPTLMRSEFNATGGTPMHQAPTVMVEGIDGFRVELGVDNVASDGNNFLTCAAGNVANYCNYQDPINITNPAKNTAHNRGDGSPDSFIHCSGFGNCATNQLINVVAAKIYVLVRNTSPTYGYVDTKTYTLGSTTLGPFNDNYKRHLYTAVVRLNNISGRREEAP